jgi:hypothetical protein
MIQVLMWRIHMFPHRESWPSETWYEGFGVGRPFAVRGILRYGTDDFGAIDPLK